MRAVWVGLVGAMMASTAQAGQCPLSGSTMTAKSVAKWSSEVSRPDLIGRTFTVEKVASRWRAPKIAEISLLVRSGEEVFVVQQVSDFSGPPVDTVASKEANRTAAQSPYWGKRSAAAEAKHFSGTLDGIASGPLTSLSLIAKPCS